MKVLAGAMGRLPADRSPRIGAGSQPTDPVFDSGRSASGRPLHPNSRPGRGALLVDRGDGSVGPRATGAPRDTGAVLSRPPDRAGRNVRPGPRRTLPDAAGRSGRRGPFDEWIALSNRLVPRSAPWGCATLCCASSRSGRVSSNGGHACTGWPSTSRLPSTPPFTADAVRARLAEANVAPLPITVLTPPVDLAADPIRPEGRHCVRREILQWRSLEASGSPDRSLPAPCRVGSSGRSHSPPRRVVGDPSHPSPIPHRLHRCGRKPGCTVPCGCATVRGHEVVCRQLHLLALQWTRRRPHRRTRAVRALQDCPIEAMAHGTIPVVVNNGGPAATVRDGIDGYHYDSVEGWRPEPPSCSRAPGRTPADA